MKSENNGIQRLAVIGIAGLLAWLGGCGGETSPAVDTGGTTGSEPAGVALSDAAIENLDLEILPLGALALRERILLQGELVLNPAGVAQVTARLSGVVQDIGVAVEADVAAGDFLGVISSQDLAERIMGYVETERRFRAAMQAVDREERLFEQEISSEEQVLAARHEYYLAEAAHSLALQKLRLLGYEEADLHAYMERPDLQDLTLYEIRAPIAGRVLEHRLEFGQAIEPGMLLFRIVDLGRMYARFALPMRYLPAVREGLDIGLANEALGLEGGGRIARVGGRMDPMTRTVPLYAELKPGPADWRPGMPVRINIEGLPTRVERGVPLEAIQSLDGRDVVFVRNADGRFEPAPVRLGRRDAMHVEILDGPEAGTPVVSRNSYLVLSAWENEG